MIQEQKIKRVLVVKPSSLGDILHVFPALDLLHRHLPNAKLDFLVHPAFAEVLHYSPWPVERTILFERKKLAHLTTFAPAFFRLLHELRRNHYDLIVDFQGLSRSAIFSFLAKGSPVVGFAEPREKPARYFYSRRIEVPAGHAVERYVNLVNGLLQLHEPPPQPVLPEKPEIKQQLTEKFGPLPERMIALIPGARWESKRFPAKLFAEIVLETAKREPTATFAILGSRSDQEAESEIVRLIAGRVPLLRFAGRTSIAQMMELIHSSAAVISNDSGPIHAAAAFSKPVIGLFGPTDPAKTGPYGKKNRIHQLNDLACIKCMKRHCRGNRFQPACHRLDAAAIATDIENLIAKEG